MLDFLDDELAETENDTRWDALLTSDDGQNALDYLADEALASIRAGESSAVLLTANGEILPERIPRSL
ncbi:MAG: hypothetical protein KJZ86_24930 [Caldilineaceae bacterium]|nr:hypothetical protein [Caldilineaceae bacterium]HRJ43766.1 hypothetical protein [Caldilineaceae bacterium]